MPAYRFVLSHASQDRDSHGTVRKFYEALSERIRLGGGVPADEVGFLDESTLNVGDPWPDVLAEALQNCRALVCLYSPWYFKSEYAGAEMAVFRSRLETFAQDHGLVSLPPLIFPVLLERLVEPVPAAIANIQYDNNRYPAAYRELRLRRLMQSNASRPNALKLIDVLADDILTTIKKYPLPPLATPPDFNAVDNLFEVPGVTGQQIVGGPAQTASPKLVGPGFVRFFFVAGTNDELRRLRKHVDQYGAVRGLQWKPYFPPVERYASVLAQEIATQLNMTSLPESLTFGTAEEFPAQLLEAQANGNVVVLLVDAWSLCLDRYLDLMRRYDGVDLWNTAVLIVWNNGDVETQAAVARLRQKVSLAFLAKRNRNDPYAYREITSPPELSASLGDMLAKMQLKIIDVTDQIARAEGDQYIPRPTISGPAAK